MCSIGRRRGERLGAMEGLCNSTRRILAALQTRLGGRFGPINEKREEPPRTDGSLAPPHPAHDEQEKPLAFRIGALWSYAS
jgi:hypothetical protein